jgi:hypothetical protein
MPIATVFLLVLILASETTTFGEYPTMAECQAELEPLIELHKFHCIEVRADDPDRPGFVNGPSIGVWYGLTDELNEKAWRGLWRHSQLDLWRSIFARQSDEDSKPVVQLGRKQIYDRIPPDDPYALRPPSMPGFAEPCYPDCATKGEIHPQEAPD